MKVKEFFSFLVLTFILAGCGSKSQSNVAVNKPTSYSVTLSGPNVVPVVVGTSDVCGQTVSGGKTSLYPNEPCASVTICVPGTSNCQTVNNILIDTGSNGLRVFSSVVTLSLPAVTVGSNQLAECAQFGTGTDWGTVVTAEVGLASEPTVRLPIQLINSAYATRPSPCQDADTDPKSAGYNGILGVGLFQEDCGTYCATHSNNTTYYSCSGSTCTATTVPVANQVQNPIALLPTDNNGLIFEMPLVPDNGASSASGSIVLGIGTQSNNTPSGVTLYAADSSGNFTTQFNNNTYSQSFIDSGSNGLFFPNNLTPCSGSSGFLCPSSPTSLSAVNTGGSGNQVQVNFTIISASTLFGSGNYALPSLGGTISLGGFDWGLPFFYGRKVFIGISSVKSSLGTGPYWAF